MTPKYPSDDVNDTLIAQGDGWDLYADIQATDPTDTFYSLFVSTRIFGMWYVPGDSSEPLRDYDADTEDWPAEAREFALAHYNLNR